MIRTGLSTLLIAALLLTGVARAGDAQHQGHDFVKKHHHDHDRHHREKEQKKEEHNDHKKKDGDKKRDGDGTK